MFSGFTGGAGDSERQNKKRGHTEKNQSHEKKSAENEEQARGGGGIRKKIMWGGWRWSTGAPGEDKRGKAGSKKNFLDAG